MENKTETTEEATTTAATEADGVVHIRKDTIPLRPEVKKAWANQSKSLLSEFAAIEGNNACIDCGDPDATWASISMGLMLCLECSGKHRSYGVQVSFVRSVTMDAWTDGQIEKMRHGGNAKFLSVCPERDYFSDEAELHRLQLEALATHEAAIPSELSEEQRQNIASRREQFREQEVRLKRGRIPPEWEADKSSSSCVQCQTKFTFTRRRHHCRKCGQLVCGSCAPASNAKPLPEFGMVQPVRHCLKCYNPLGK